jgi:hypothetical protein
MYPDDNTNQIHLLVNESKNDIFAYIYGRKELKKEKKDR